MQILLFLRSEVYNLEKLIHELSSIYLKFTYFKPDPNKPGAFLKDTSQQYQTQVTVRSAPLGIYEICFPEEHLDLMLNTLFRGERGHTWQSWMGKYVKLLRKFMRLEDMPKKYDTSKYIPIGRDDIEFIFIGLKKDRRENGIEQI